MNCEIMISGKIVCNIQLDKTLNNRVSSNEGDTLEFKESYSSNSNSVKKYSKTMAAFANNIGGCIIFGIIDKTKELCGLTSEKLKMFEDIKIEKITGTLNSHFSPEIIWDLGTQTINGKTVGIIYVHKSSQKPIICHNADGKILKQSAIYYRYSARSEIIKYAELRGILDACRREEENKWREIIMSIAQAGIDNVTVLNLSNGEFSETEGKSFLIDDALLDKVHFIKEGDFSQNSGAPAFKLIGEVKPYKIGFTNQKSSDSTKAIFQEDIIKTFLENKKVANPEEYLKAMYNDTALYLPYYYFMYLTGMTVEETCNMLRSLRARKKPKKNLLDRLEKERSLYKELKNTGSFVYYEKCELKRKIFVKDELQALVSLDMRILSEVILSFNVAEVKEHEANIRDLLTRIYNERFNSEKDFKATMFRKAVCWIDEALYLRR